MHQPKEPFSDDDDEPRFQLKMLHGSPVRPSTPHWTMRKVGEKVWMREWMREGE